MEACESAALDAGFRQLELVATLPGEPLYRAFGYEVAERFEVALSGKEILPVARMKKSIIQRCNASMKL